MSSNPLSYLKQAREWAYPKLKSSAFLTRGVLTPEEFVLAGDELVFKCPTWSWESGDPKRAKSYLPADKQFLVTRNVPCQTRVSSLEDTMMMTDNTGCGDGDDDWLVSHMVKQTHGDIEDEFDVLDDEGEIVESSKPAATNGAAAAVEEDDDEYADMADFEDENVLEDDAAVVAESTVTKASDDADGDDGNLVKVRTYDLSITYDKYYQTPRVWMMGYTADGNRQPLTGQEMMEDVMSDYANRTVTIETHPHVTGPHASIHPCQHGKVMKTIVRNLINASSSDDLDGNDGEEGPSIEMYLFIFLKFVSSIIPTINYDFTMEVTASTKK